MLHRFNIYPFSYYCCCCCYTGNPIRTSSRLKRNEGDNNTNTNNNDNDGNDGGGSGGGSITNSNLSSHQTPSAGTTRKIFLFLFVLTLVPFWLYLGTSPPSPISTTLSLFGYPIYKTYQDYTSGNFSCNLPIQPWYHAQTTEPTVVVAYGSRIASVVESAFRIKVGKDDSGMLFQHYLYIQVPSLEAALKLAPYGNIIYLVSTQVRDFTDYTLGKELRGSSVKNFISDWDYTVYVTTHVKNITIVNTTRMSDYELIKEVYNLLPYEPYYPVETFEACLDIEERQKAEEIFLKRCLISKRKYVLLKGDC